MTYTDNWNSEMHEKFGFWDFLTWKKQLEKAGFKIVPGSMDFRSDYIIDKVYRPRVNLYRKSKNGLMQIDYSQTNMIPAGEKST